MSTAGVTLVSPPMMSLPSIEALMWVEFVIAASMVGVRTWVQYRHSKRFFLNDYFIFCAISLHLIVAIMYHYLLPKEYNLNYISRGLVTPDANFHAEMRVFLKLHFAIDMLLWSGLWCVKFSLLFFFWRLFDAVKSRGKIFWWIMCFITASTWTISIILQVFACDPPGNFFELGKCATPRDVYFANLVFQFSTGTDIAGDIFILMIPFPLLRRLQITPRSKYILISIFLLPLIPIAFASLRLAYCNPKSGYVDTIKFQFYSMLEITVAIITACLPSLRLFVTHRKKNNTGSGPYYEGGSTLVDGSHDQSRSQSRNAAHKGAIPLDTLVDTRNGEVIDVGSLSSKLRPEPREEALDFQERTPPNSNSVLVTKEYSVVRYEV